MYWTLWVMCYSLNYAIFLTFLFLSNHYIVAGCLDLFRFGFILIAVFLAVTACSYSRAMKSKVLSKVLRPWRARTLTNLQALCYLYHHLSFSTALSHSISARLYRVSVCTCAAQPWATDSWCIHTWTPGLHPTPPRTDALPVPCPEMSSHFSSLELRFETPSFRKTWCSLCLHSSSSVLVNNLQQKTEVTDHNCDHNRNHIAA